GPHIDYFPLVNLRRRWVAASGRPALLNTSFNLHEEPLVCSPLDAVRAFLASGLSRMRLGPFVVRHPAPRWSPLRPACPRDG
ncbi:MAG: carbamoyltransferase C-terminal domain-containing protein, partial [Planctomycetota bacterium]